MYLKKTNLLSNSKINLLWLLLFSIAFFALLIGFTITTQAAVPPPTLNYNLTWNSVSGENFTSKVDVMVQVNSGIKDSKVVLTEQNGYFDTDGLDVAVGDTITVLDPDLGNVSMIVANLSAEMAVDGQNADQVWGQGPSNDQVKVQINPDEESDSQTAAATRIADTGDQGDFTADFGEAGQGEPAFDILNGDRAQIVYTSVSGHNTIVNLSTPVLTADLTSEIITGDSFTLSSQVNVSVNGGQSQLVEVMEWGSFELRYPGLKAGDNIQADTGNGIYTMEVADLSADVNLDQNTVFGIAPQASSKDAQVNIEVWRQYPNESWASMQPDIQQDNTFEANFDNVQPQPYTLTLNDDITVIQRGTNGHYTEIQVQRAPGHITVNYSHDWVEINNFDSNGQDLIIKVNGGVANGGVEKQVAPEYGWAHANFSDSGYQIKPGDNISVWDLNNNQLAQMTVANIKGLVADNKKVTGTVPLDTDSIKGELFPPGDYPKDSIEWQDATITGGNYQINFQNNVLPRSEVWVHQYSTDNYNETIYVASKPRLTTNFSHDWVNGDYLPVQEGTPIQVQVARNGSPVGSIGNTEVNPYGSFNMNWEDDENRPDIQPGDEVTASWAGGSISMTVQELTADVKYNENTVTGNAPPNTEVSVRVNRGDNVEWPEMDDTSDGNGDFGVDFDDHKDDEGKDDPVDITPEDEVWVHQYAGDGNETILVTGTSYLATNFTNDWVEGYYLPKETAIAVQVNRPGSGQQGVIGNTQTNSNGFFNMNWYEVDGLQDIDRPDIQIGDEVIVSWDGGNASMTVQNVTGKVDHGNNFVKGTAPDGTDVNVMVNNEWPGFDTTAAGGQFSVDFNNTNPLVDIRPRDRIEVRQFDANGNQTILDTGTPLLVTNINHGWVGGNNFPAYEKVFIQVTRGGVQVGDVGSTFAQGNGSIWYGWNQEGERVPNLKPGDIVNASWNGGSAQMTVANIGGVMDPGWDRVTGQVPPQTEEIRGELFPPGDYPKDWIEEQTASISGSDYTLDFNTNLTSNYEVWVYHNAIDGNETIFIAGNWPVALLAADPNPALVGQPVTLDASGSKHFVTTTTKSIVRYDWDFNYDGTFNADEWEQLGDPNFDGKTTRTFNQPGPVQVAVRVTDNNNPERVDVEVITLQLVSIDTVPDPFSFTDQIDVPLSSLRESNQIVVSGINSASPISIIGGEYSVNNLPFNNAVGFVNNGDLVKVRQTSASSYSTTTNAILTIGGISDTFSVTTIAQPQVGGNTGGGNTGGGQQPGPGGQPGDGAPAPVVNKNQTQIDALNKQIKALNKKIASYNKQIKNLKKKLKKANAKQKAALKKQIGKANKQLKALKKKIANLKNKLKKLK